MAAESLKATINTTQDLHTVVKTMKALAAVSIRQYQEAVESLSDYNRTVERGLQILMQQRRFADQPALLPATVGPSSSIRRLGAIIFGSDQGLCGQFNEQIAAYAIAHLRESPIDLENQMIAAVGVRLAPSLESQEYAPSELFSVPRSVSEITDRVQDLLLAIEEWRSERELDQLLLFYNHPQSGASYRQDSLQLLPLDLGWLQDLGQQEWPTSVIPTFTMDWRSLFSALLREYLFGSLYRAFAASLASENASRLASMQSAQTNIEERLEDLQAQYHRRRQSAITAELLDVVSGFEALTDS